MTYQPPTTNGQHYNNTADQSFLDDLYANPELIGQIPLSSLNRAVLATNDLNQYMYYTPSASMSRTISTHDGSSGVPPHTGSSSPAAYAQQGFSAQHLQQFYQPNDNGTVIAEQTQYMHLMSAASTHRSLSPGSASAYNKTSPSVGLMGESIDGYGDISEHTTPCFDEDVLGATIDLTPVLDGEEFTQSGPAAGTGSYAGVSSHASPSSKHEKNDSIGTTNSSYLLSPVNTSTPSPSSKSDNYRNISVGPSPFTGVTPTSTKRKNQDVIHFPSTEQQTPEFTGSSNSSGGSRDFGPSSADVFPSSTHLLSPIVKVENFSGEDSAPEEYRPVRRLSKRNRPVDLFHLAPQQDESESSEDEMPADEKDLTARSMPGISAVRGSDGSWMPSPKTGQGGLNPEMREQLGDTLIPNLKEQELERQIAERNQEVAEWLQRSQSIRAMRRPKGARRRARSMGDVPRLDNEIASDGHGELEGDGSGIPGPGVLLDEKSEDEYDEEDEDQSSEVAEDEDSAMLDTSPPASVHAVNPLEDMEREMSLATLADAEPLPHQFYRPRPWRDTPPIDGARPPLSAYQPTSSNAAIMRFNRVADNYDTASRVATWGTRRLSETDVDRIGPRGLLKRLSFGKDKEKSKENTSFLTDVKKLMPKRSSSNLKRKTSDREPTFRKGEHKESISSASGITLGAPTRVSSFGKPKLNTGSAVAAMAGQIAAIGAGGAGSVSATATAPPTSPWAQAKHFVKRSRSRSDLGRKTSLGDAKSPGLSALMTQHGGPPMPTLASPPPRTEEIKMLSPGDNEDEDDDDAEDDGMDEKGITMELKVRTDPIIPNYAGFQTHVKQLNPRLSSALIDRISHEQVRRHKKLVDFRTKHAVAVSNRKCSSGAYCFALGGEAKILPPKTNSRDAEASFAGFQITTASHSEDESGFGEGAVAAAQFPLGVPLPPVKRLPAEFECPLCFKVKKFQKPSDWTKHVHEDVQPFTCTFPNCSEPKSFKRKADWVRHENERHRQLEWWTCNLPDCSHTCFRKDNFVQHLVREHKKPEPKVKATKAAMKATAAGKGRGHLAQGGTTGRWQTANGGMDGDQEEIDKVWQLVEECHHDTNKQPREEPCKFCGNICNSWKKLTVHLARHMEQISLPVLALVEQKNISTGTVPSSLDQHDSAQVMTSHPQSWGGTPMPMSYSMQGSVSPIGIVSTQYSPLQSQGAFYAPNTGAQIGNYIAQGSNYTHQSPVNSTMPPYPDHGNGGYAAAPFTQFQDARGPQFPPSHTGSGYPDPSPTQSFAGFEPMSGPTLGLPIPGYSSPDNQYTTYNRRNNYTSPMEHVSPYQPNAADMQGSAIGVQYGGGTSGITYGRADSESSSNFVQQQLPQNFAYGRQ